VEPARVDAVDRGVAAAVQQSADQHLPASRFAGMAQVDGRQQDLPPVRTQAVTDRVSGETARECLLA
jgi:hypothetical protein